MTSLLQPVDLTCSRRRWNQPRAGATLRFLLLLSLTSWAGAQPRLTLPQQFFDPRTSETNSFDLLESLSQDVNCSRHPLGQRMPNPLVGKNTEEGFEVHFARPLCTTGFPLGGDYKLCLDGVEVGTAKFVDGPAPYFLLQTDAETASRLQSALAP